MRRPGAKTPARCRRYTNRRRSRNDQPALGESETRPYKSGAQTLARALRECDGRAQRRRQDGGLPDDRQAGTTQSKFKDATWKVALHEPRTTAERGGTRRAGLRPAPTKLVRRHSHAHCANAAAARKDAGKMAACRTTGRLALHKANSKTPPGRWRHTTPARL